MRWNVNMAGMTFLATQEAGPKKDEKGMQRFEKDASGRPLWTIEVLAMDADPEKRGEAITITTAGQRPEVHRGEFVVLVGFQIMDWKLKDGRSGTSFRADEIHSAVTAAPASKPLKAVG